MQHSETGVCFVLKMRVFVLAYDYGGTIMGVPGSQQDNMSGEGKSKIISQRCVNFPARLEKEEEENSRLSAGDAGCSQTMRVWRDLQEQGHWDCVAAAVITYRPLLCVWDVSRGPSKGSGTTSRAGNRETRKGICQRKALFLVLWPQRTIQTESSSVCRRYFPCCYDSVLVAVTKHPWPKQLEVLYISSS